MDKYEYRIKTEQMLKLVESKDYKRAMEIADSIDWRRVKSVSMLCTVSEIYEQNRKYEMSREILLIAYDRAPIGRTIIYQLGELALKLGDINEAIDCFEEFVHIAPKDTRQYILRYKIYQAQGAPIEQQIIPLEELREIDYHERWVYELALLYEKNGEINKCIETCDELILWFNEGEYVYRAIELKAKHKPLTPAQQDKLNQRRNEELTSARFKAPKPTPVTAEDMRAKLAIKQEEERAYQQELQEQYEREQQEKEQQERERLAREQYEREQQEKEQYERERLAQEQYERERMVQEQLERERLAREQYEREQQEKEQLERERLAREQYEREQYERGFQQQQYMQNSAVTNGDYSYNNNYPYHDFEFVDMDQPAAHTAIEKYSLRNDDLYNQPSYDYPNQEQNYSNPSFAGSRIPKAEASMFDQNQYAGYESDEMMYEQENQDPLDQSFTGRFEKIDEQRYNSGFVPNLHGEQIKQAPVRQEMPKKKPKIQTIHIPEAMIETEPRKGGILDKIFGRDQEPERMTIRVPDSREVQEIYRQEETAPVFPKNEPVVERSFGTQENNSPSYARRSNGVQQEAVKRERTAQKPVRQGSKFDTMDLQQELAKNMAEFMPHNQVMESAVSKHHVQPEPKVHVEVPPATHYESNRELMMAATKKIPNEDIRRAELENTKEFVIHQNYPSIGSQVFKNVVKEHPELSELQSKPIQSKRIRSEALLDEEEGQIGLFLQEQNKQTKQVTGQLKVEDILSEWEQKKQKTKEAIAQAAIKKEERPPKVFVEPKSEVPPEVLKLMKELESENRLSEPEIKEEAEEEIVQDVKAEAKKETPVKQEKQIVLSAARSYVKTDNLNEPDSISAARAEIMAALANRNKRNLGGGTGLEKTSKQKNEPSKKKKSGQLVQVPSAVKKPTVTNPGINAVKGSLLRDQIEKELFAPLKDKKKKEQNTIQKEQQSEALLEELESTAWKNGTETAILQSTEEELEASSGKTKAELDLKALEEEAKADSSQHVKARAEEQIAVTSEAPAQMQAEELFASMPEPEEEAVESEMGQEPEEELFAGDSEPEITEALVQPEEIEEEIPVQPEQFVPEQIVNETEEMVTEQPPEEIPEEVPAKEEIAVEPVPQMQEEPKAGPELQEIGNDGKPKLTAHQKELFSYFTKVRGMEQQIADILYADQQCTYRNGTSITGNVVIMGRPGAGKTMLAINLVKAIQRGRNMPSGRLAKITAESLNTKSIQEIIQKLNGGALLIEQANNLSLKVLDELGTALKGNTGELFVILEGEKAPMKLLLDSSPAFAKLFNQRIEVPVFMNDELVAFGQTYAKEHKYLIDDMGVLALYSRIDEMQLQDHAVNVTEVKEIIDDAIEHASKKGMKKAFGKLFGAKNKTEEFKTLKEVDFEA